MLLYILILVLVLVFMIIYYKNDILKYISPVYFNPILFPKMNILQKNWRILKDECAELDMDILPISRKKDDWAQKVSPELLKQGIEKIGWLRAWNYNNDENEDWLNFGLIFQGQPLKNVEKCPKTYELLKKIPGINIAGFSLLRPGCSLGAHRDTTGLKYNSLAYHLGLNVPDGDNSTLTVDGDTKFQKNGKVIIFDSTYKHSAKNSNKQNRIIFYVDFKIN